MSQFETREMDLEVRYDPNTRELSGIAVPYGQVSPFYNERFMPGSVTLAPEALLMWQHDRHQPLGKITKGYERADGFYFDSFISDTALGRDAATLAADGVLKLSVGFIMGDSTRGADGVTEVRSATVHEVSLVSFPAYAGANVTSVRDEPEQDGPVTAIESEENVDEIRETAPELAEVRERIEMVEREIATLGKVEAPAEPAYRSAGEFLKAAVAGEEAAVRSFATTANSVTTPYDVDLIKLVDLANTGVGTVFSRGTTPATGMTIEYVRLEGITDGTGDQVDEGDALGYVQVDLTTDSAPIKTVGNHIALSRQVIERSTAPFLDSSLRAQANALGMNLHNKIVDVYQAEVAAQITATHTVSAGAGDYKGWAGALADAQAQYFQPLGLSVEALIVDTETFKDLIALDGTPVISFAAEANGAVGSANPRGLRGTLCGVPIVVDASLATDGSEVAFVNSAAIRQYTSGAVRLSDSAAVELIEKFSLYTYEATVLEWSAIVPVTVGA